MVAPDWSLVQDLGLRPVEPEPLPEPIGPDDLGVVCWMAVVSGTP